MPLDIELSLLTFEQVSGPKKLEVFDKIGIQAEPTDFASLSGARKSIATNQYTRKIKTYADYFLNSDYKTIDYVDAYGEINTISPLTRNKCIRPVVQYSKIKDICQNKRTELHDIEIVDCGMYAQTLTEIEKEKDLDQKLKLGALEKIDYITTDMCQFNDYDIAFSRKEQPIFLDKEDDKLYFKTTPNDDTYEFTDNRKYRKRDRIWVNYSLVEWIVVEDTDIAFTRKGICTAIQYNNIETHCDQFQYTHMYHYMNKYLVKDMFSTYLQKIKKENTTTNEDSKITSQIKYLESLNQLLEEQISDMEIAISKNQQQIIKNNEMIKQYKYSI